MATDWTVRAITRAMLPVLMVLTLVELGSGLVLGSFESQLLRYPSLLVLVPVTIGSAGNLGSVLAARLSTSFHLGTLSFSPDDDELTGNAVATVALALTMFPIIGAGAWLLTLLLSGRPALSLGTILTVAIASGAALAVVAVAVTFTTTYIAYRFGLDPDDVVIPVVTNVCDVLGVLVLFAAAQVFV